MVLTSYTTIPDHVKVLLICSESDLKTPHDQVRMATNADTMAVWLTQLPHVTPRLQYILKNEIIQHDSFEHFKVVVFSLRLYATHPKSSGFTKTPLGFTTIKPDNIVK